MTFSISELEALITRHNYLYWQQQPEITDTEYDLLVEQLRSLHPTSTVLNHLGFNFDEVGTKVYHQKPMLSLDKCYDEENLIKWTEKSPVKCNWVMMPKIDGMACSLLYKNGRLIQGATRGTGTVGEDITQNISQIVPNKIELLGEIEIRGELYMPISVFTQYQLEYSNPRNAVAGFCKRKEQSQNIGIKFLAYDLINATATTMVDKLTQLSLQGFDIPFWKLFNSNFLMQPAFEEVLENRATYDYEMDGIVFRINEDNVYEEMGYTTHHPKGAIAYKFSGDEKITTLKNVSWQVSRTGLLTPLAHIEPVYLNGANISKITLHHANMIKIKNLSLNAQILVSRRGGVIPHVEKVIVAGDLPIEIPTQCASCQGQTYFEGDFLQAHHTEECVSRLSQRINYFITQMEIEGIGPSWVEKLIDENLIRDIPDLFRLNRDTLIGLDGIGDTRINGWLSSIQQAQKIELSRFLTALGIDNLGKKTAEDLVQQFKDLNTIRNLSLSQITSLHGFAEKTAHSILQGLQTKATLIDALLEFISFKEITSHTGSLQNLNFLFTGTLHEIKRQEAEALVMQQGGNIASTVNKNLNYLVVGEKAGSKLEKAQKLGIKILNETEFLELIRK
jgi:DNA ligase (NAD+)